MERVCKEKLLKVPKKVLVHSMKFVDQIINSHVPITGVLHHLVVTTPFYLNILLCFLAFPLLGLTIVIIFFIFDYTVSFGLAQKHLKTPDRIVTRHPSCHLHRIISSVTCSEGYLCKIDMKTLWRL